MNFVCARGTWVTSGTAIIYWLRHEHHQLLNTRAAFHPQTISNSMGGQLLVGILDDYKPGVIFDSQVMESSKHAARDLAVLFLSNDLQAFQQLMFCSMRPVVLLLKQSCSTVSIIMSPDQEPSHHNHNQDGTLAQQAPIRGGEISTAQEERYGVDRKGLLLKSCP